MKRVVFLVLACCALVVSCSSSSSGDDSYSLNPSDLQASGATTYAASLSDVVSCLQEVPSDVVMQDFSDKSASSLLVKTFAALSGQENNLAVLSEKNAAKIRSAATISTNGQGRSTATASLDLTGESIGTYFTIKKGVVSYTLKLTTKDNNLLNLSTFSNWADSSLDGNASLLVKGQNLPAASIIKDIVLSADGSGKIGFSGITGGIKTDDTEFLNFLLNGDTNIVFGCSINSNGVGGKIILTAKATEQVNIPDTSTLDGDYSAFYPTAGAVVLSVYDDSNGKVYSQQWASVTDFFAALSAFAK